MKIPRDIRADQLVNALGKLGYKTTRQRGSHIRVTTEIGGEHHEVVPRHKSIKVGTLRSILKSVADHHQLSLEELIKTLGL